MDGYKNGRGENEYGGESYNGKPLSESAKGLHEVDDKNDD